MITPPEVPGILEVVTPFTGVWIEISSVGLTSANSIVTPFTGVWIEMRRLSLGW